MQCDSQSRTQQQEQDRLRNYWQKRLAKMEQEYSKKHAKQAAESNTIREECSVAMTRVRSLALRKPDPSALFSWHRITFA